MAERGSDLGSHIGHEYVMSGERKAANMSLLMSWWALTLSSVFLRLLLLRAIPAKLLLMVEVSVEPLDSLERLKIKSCGTRKRVETLQLESRDWNLKNSVRSGQDTLQACNFLQSPAFCQPVI